MKSGNYIILSPGLLLAIMLSLGTTSCALKFSGAGGTESYIVREVIDGDTFRIDDGSEKGTKVRLIGVDAPETRRTRTKEIGFYAQESGQYLRDLIEGKKVRLEYDVDTLDLYGRTLAYVYTDKNLFVNAELVKKGYAMIMTVPPNVKYAEKFVKLARKARMKERGLWSEEKCVN
jgi:micrococcal nuclease